MKKRNVFEEIVQGFEELKGEREGRERCVPLKLKHCRQCRSRRRKLSRFGSA
jgi:hypothetical protein